MRRLACLLTIACTFLWVRLSHAATIAILESTSDAKALVEARFRLQGELLAVGLSVANAERPPFSETHSPEARAWLERTSRERAIDAFIDVIGNETPFAVDVWICERSPRLLRVTRVTLEPDVEDRAATLAIRAIEVLRSSFIAIDLQGGSEPRRPVPAPEPAARAKPVPARADRLGLEAGATALTSFDGVGAALLPLARLDWAVSPWLAVQATVAGFGTRARVDTASGGVDVTQQFGLLGLCVCKSSPFGLHPLAALSAGALRTALDGRAVAPSLGHRVDRWALLVDGSVGARLSLPDDFYLTLASHVQVANPYVAIHVLDDVVATTGRPNLLLALTVGVRL